MGSRSYCLKEKKPCIGWVEKYLKDCLCNLRDEISFGFGLISLICWGVAEIPQIITNFQAKSGHGVSLAFLMTWVVGDVFNLVGCHLEPVTLPTQLYTAVLYTATTVILVLQTIYYDYVSRWWKSREEIKLEAPAHTTKPTKPESRDSSVAIQTSSPGFARHNDVYFISARSLASSGAPSSGSYLVGPRSGPPAAGLDLSSDDEESFQQSSKRSTQPIRIPRSAAGYATFLAASANLPFGSKGLMETCMGLSGGRRRLLQEEGIESNPIGIWLGWLMAAIYMGGRLPQIFLNIKRGSVEGMNPLMFIFALVANATYVGSILMRSVEWERIKPNMPWLLDAIVCVALDLFIILQYVYYRFMRSSNRSHGNEYTDMEAKQPLVS